MWAMFDIDDTLIQSDTGRCIPDTCDLLNYCNASGMEIIIITARPGNASSVEYTVKELEKNGLYYDVLVFCPPEDKGYAKVSLTGGPVFLSVGDQPTDLTDTLHTYIPSTSTYSHTEGR